MEELKVDYPGILMFTTKKYELPSFLSSMIIDYLPNKRLSGYGDILTPLQITTATMAYNSNIKMDYRLMAKYIKKNDTDILAVKSPDIPLEECIKNKYTRAGIISKRRGRIINKHANSMVKQYRRTAGNGLYFNSSFEMVIGKIKEDDTIKKYNIRISPSKGSIQIQGLDPPIYTNATKYINRVLSYIKDSLELEEPHQIYNTRLIIVNFKTEVVSEGANKYIRLMLLSNLIKNIMENKDKHNLHELLPYNIVYNTQSEEIGSYIRLKFATPLPNMVNRKTTVKIFSGRKINILGGAHSIPVIKIYKFLDKLFLVHYQSLIIYRVVLKKYTTKKGEWITLF